MKYLSVYTLISVGDWFEDSSEHVKNPQIFKYILMYVLAVWLMYILMSILIASKLFYNTQYNANDMYTLGNDDKRNTVFSIQKHIKHYCVYSLRIS